MDLTTMLIYKVIKLTINFAGILDWVYNKDI